MDCRIAESLAKWNGNVAGLRYSLRLTRFLGDMEAEFMRNGKWAAWGQGTSSPSTILGQFLRAHMDIVLLTSASLAIDLITNLGI